MHRLLQADPSKEKVKTVGDGIKLSSKEVVQEHNENILEGMSSIKDTMKTPRTGGQQSNPKIDASKNKGDKGHNKHKHKKSKVTFAQLLDKYQNKSEENDAYRSSNAKASRSPPRRKSKDQYWQEGNFNPTCSYHYFGSPMPMPWMPPYAHVDRYSSWDRYNIMAHSPSYSRPSHHYYAAPGRSTFSKQSYVQDRFNKKESVRSSRKRKR